MGNSTVRRLQDKNRLDDKPLAGAQWRYLYYPALIVMYLFLRRLYNIVWRFVYILQVSTTAVGADWGAPSHVDTAMTVWAVRLTHAGDCLYQPISTAISVGDYAPHCHKLIPYSQVTLKSRLAFT